MDPAPGGPRGPDGLLAELRSRIRRLERPGPRPSAHLPFGIRGMDQHLPEAGLNLSALHEIEGGGADSVHVAAGSLFISGILARLSGPVLWCLPRPASTLFAPGLDAAGLASDRLILAEAPDENTVLLVMEEALRHPALAAVTGELTRLPMAASRRLALAAERSGVTAFVLRRRPEGRAGGTGLSAAATRWRITPLPSAPLPCPGIGRPRWLVELTRCRGGEAARWIVEACDATGHLSVPAELADRPAAPAGSVAA